MDKTIERAIISIFSDLSPYPMTTIIQGSNKDMGDLLSAMRTVTTPASIVQRSITAAMMLSQELTGNRMNPGNEVVDHFRGTGTSL